jgi:hypothetical protein
MPPSYKQDARKVGFGVRICCLSQDAIPEQPHALGWHHEHQLTTLSCSVGAYDTCAWWSRGKWTPPRLSAAKVAGSTCGHTQHAAHTAWIQQHAPAGQPHPLVNLTCQIRINGADSTLLNNIHL